MLSSRLLANDVKLGTFSPVSSVIDANKDLGSSVGVTNKVESVISEVVGLVTIVGGIALLFYFIIGALNWISAAGDTGKIEKARQEMIQAVAGMVFLVAAYGLIGVVSTFLGLHILNPGEAIRNIVK